MILLDPLLEIDLAKPAGSSSSKREDMIIYITTP